MEQAITWITDVFGMTITTFGVSPNEVDVTLGMLAAVTLIFGFGVQAFKRVKGRG